MLVVYGSANNFDHSIREGDLAAGRGALLEQHPWQAEFERLVNERSLPSAIEDAFRQGVDASAALALLHKAMMRGFVENDPFARLAIAKPASAWTPKPIAPMADEEAYFRLYTSYADAMIAATRRADQDIAFVWEYHLGDLGGQKPFSAEEAGLYPNVKRSAEEIGYDRRMRDRWKAFLMAQNVPAVDPYAAITSTPKTVFIDYLHYTANGNAVVARATYDQLRDTLVRKLEARRAEGTIAR
jgi:hypothetical protein